MSEDLTSSGDEGVLRIDTERNSASEKGKTGKGKGRAKVGEGRGAAKNGQQEQGSSLKPGNVVWAKVAGFKFWPAMVFCLMYIHHACQSFQNCVSKLRCALGGGGY